MNADALRALLDTMPMTTADRVVESIDDDTGPLEDDAEELARWMQDAAAVLAGVRPFPA